MYTQCTRTPNNVFNHIAVKSKDTHRERVPSNKTQTISESMNMDIWVIGIFNSLNEIHKLKQNFRKNKLVTDETQFFVIGPFCNPHSVCLNIILASDRVECCIFNLSTFN